MIWWILLAAGLLFIAYETVRVERFIHVYQKGQDYEKTVRILNHQKRLDRAIRDVDNL